MPTYTYECDRCRKTYDIDQRMTDSHIEKCPACGSLRFKRIICAPMVLTKSKTTIFRTESTSSMNERVAAFVPGGLNCSMDPNIRLPSLGVRIPRKNK